jgi:hypothetical protein
MPQGALHVPLPAADGIASAAMYPSVASTMQGPTNAPEPNVAPVVTPDTMWRVNVSDRVVR